MCYFDPSILQRNVTTFGGLSTHEEMCESFVMYYPRILTAGCVTSVQYPAPAGVCVCVWVWVCV